MHAWGKPMPFPVLLDPSFTTCERYGLAGVWSVLILIDPQGNLVKGDEKVLAGKTYGAGRSSEVTSRPSPGEAGPPERRIMKPSKRFLAGQPTRRPWRRFARFSVRGLVSLILLIGAVLGWLVRSAHIQRDAVAAIRRAGGSVMYDWQWKNGEPNANGKLRWPKWLVDLIGIDYFGHVTRVEFAEHGCDADLVQVARLGRLASLNLARSPVTDVGISHLSGLSSLESLDLSQTNITDARSGAPEGACVAQTAFP